MLTNMPEGNYHREMNIKLRRQSWKKHSLPGITTCEKVRMKFAWEAVEAAWMR